MSTGGGTTSGSEADLPECEYGPLDSDDENRLSATGLVYYTPGRDGTRNAARRPGSGGCPRGCGFEEQGGACARIQRGVYPL